MPTFSRFYLAENDIRHFFRDSAQKVFTRTELDQIFSSRRGIWNLPVSMTDQKFIDRLLQREILQYEKLIFESYGGEKVRFVVPDTSPFVVAASLLPKAFLSHYTATYLLGLTTQVPKIIYVSSEQSKKNTPSRVLQQTDIDSAFSQPQRESGARARYQDYTIVLLNPKHTGRVGVTTLSDGLPVAGLERTLIDCTVRPAYAGGIQAVADLYESALSDLSINKLLATLETMDFIYPYHQAIGFYLEKAGADERKLAAFQQIPQQLDFYLTYAMEEKDYSPRWRLYYPKGM